MKTINNPLRLYHMPQVPCKPFYVEVESEKEAFKIMNVLIEQHKFLFEENIIPDYSNVMGVEMFEDNEWTSYYNEEEGLDFDDFADKYLKVE